MQNPKVGDKCEIKGCPNVVWTIVQILRPEGESPKYNLRSNNLRSDNVVQWLPIERFDLLPPGCEPKNPLTWIKIGKTKLTTPEIYEEVGVLRDLIYNPHEYTINYDLIQEDGSWKHFTIVLPDCAEVTIGRTTVD